MHSLSIWNMNWSKYLTETQLSVSYKSSKGMLWTHLLRSQDLLSAAAFSLSSCIYLFPSFINRSLFKPFPRYCFHNTCNLQPWQLWGMTILKGWGSPRPCTSVTHQSGFAPSVQYSVPRLIYFICMGICLGFLICSSAPLKSGLELQ